MDAARRLSPIRVYNSWPVDTAAAAGSSSGGGTPRGTPRTSAAWCDGRRAETQSDPCVQFLASRHGGGGWFVFRRRISSRNSRYCRRVWGLAGSGVIADDDNPAATNLPWAVVL